MTKKKEEPEMTEEERKQREIVELMEKYKSRVAAELNTSLEESPETKEISSKEYEDFKDEYMPRHMTIYEQLCRTSENLLKIKPDAKKIPEYEEAINTCHLNVTPAGVVSFSFLAPIIVIVFGGL